MPNEELIRELATQACCQALQETLQDKSRELAEDVARRMGATLASQPTPSRRGARSRQLRDGVLLISNARTQTETLEALLAASSSLTPACGLLILRGAQASGWGSIGFASAEKFKAAVMDCARGAAATVISSCAARTAKASELDPAFAARLGLESSAEVLLLPVLLKDRVAALLLALSGDLDDLAGLELLVQVSQLGLELQSYRKAAAQTASEAPQPAPQPPSRAESATATKPEAATISQPAPEEPTPSEASGSTSPVQTVAAEEAPAEPSVSPASGSPSTQSAAQAPDEAHERGRRFAKLLVEEIKLYNSTKVSEGRANRDLYSRLREDIEKSRAAYQKRYGESVKDVDYFTQELMRILADNDRTLMGAGFPG
jgi:hypothetical protein